MLLTSMLLPTPAPPLSLLPTHAQRPIPPPDVFVPVEGVFALPITKTTTCLRGICNERLKYEVEYGLKQGTSENSYLIKAPGGGTVLVDIPFKAFLEPFRECLAVIISSLSWVWCMLPHLLAVTAVAQLQEEAAVQVQRLTCGLSTVAHTRRRDRAGCCRQHVPKSVRPCSSS